MRKHTRRLRHPCARCGARDHEPLALEHLYARAAVPGATPRSLAVWRTVGSRSPAPSCPDTIRPRSCRRCRGPDSPRPPRQLRARGHFAALDSAACSAGGGGSCAVRQLCGHEEQEHERGDLERRATQPPMAASSAVSPERVVGVAAAVALDGEPGDRSRSAMNRSAPARASRAADAASRAIRSRCRGAPAARRRPSPDGGTRGPRSRAVPRRRLPRGRRCRSERGRRTPSVEPGRIGSMVSLGTSISR